MEINAIHLGINYKDLAKEQAADPDTGAYCTALTYLKSADAEYQKTSRWTADLSFLSELWTSLACLMGTSLHTTTAYNPAANGMMERVHRSLKVALMACCTGEDRKNQLPWVLLGLQTTPGANGKESPVEQVYREPMAVPGEFFPTNADDAESPLLGFGRPQKVHCPASRSSLIEPKKLPSEGPSSVLQTFFIREDAHC
ncbi:uncharacterized protein LOC135211528 [Macrobrachium nipponense]|uniref:uncharacterized protein LOC135211528 n=1 Tax=Macrobrachium nipponense TaxID=159736 RepID=UPI0030C8A331